jgi:tripartite-type tricarboxylate transporter receptor subunit TctC
VQLFANYLTDGRLRIPVQFATARDPAMPEVPTVVELARDGEGAQVFRYLVANDEIGRSLFATPNVPPARLAQLRAAFAAMLNDAEFRAEAEQLRLPLAPRSGEEMARLVEGVFAISPEVMAKIREMAK